MSGNYFLDTNIVIAYLADEALLKKRLKSGLRVYLPTIVLGELFYGAFHSLKCAENMKSIEEFSLDTAILGPDYETARFFGKIKAELRKKGKPLPENDIWIAAMAIQHDAFLVTRDEHFNHIHGLNLQKW